MYYNKVRNVQPYYINIGEAYKWYIFRSHKLVIKLKIENIPKFEKIGKNPIKFGINYKSQLFH